VPFLLSIVYNGARVTMNRTRGFINLNRFKSGKAVKRLKNTVIEPQKVSVGRRKGRSKKK